MTLTLRITVALLSRAMALQLKNREPGLNLIPPGFTTGLAAGITQPVLVNLQPPVGGSSLKGNIDSLMKIEGMRDASEEAYFVSRKSALLRDEMMKIHDISAGHHSFLGFSGYTPVADMSVKLHPPQEDAASIKAATDALLKVEASKDSARNAEDSADKNALLAAARASFLGDSAATPYETGVLIGKTLENGLQDSEITKFETWLRNSAEQASPKSSFLTEKAINLHIGETSQDAVKFLNAENLALSKQLLKSSFLEAPSDYQKLSAGLPVSSDAMSHYADQLEAGGDTAARALSNILSSSSAPGIRPVLFASPVIRAAANLMMEESTPDYVKELAGSVITFVTNMPIASSVADTQSGSAGHVNIVLPNPSRVYGMGDSSA